MELVGTEERTLEAAGTISRAAAEALVGSGVLAENQDGRTPVSLLVFAMHGLTLRPLPGPGLDYGEALWRVGCLWEGQRAWFAVACDLDSALVRALGARLVRYPVRRGEILLTDYSAEVTAGGRATRVRAYAQAGSPAPVPPRPALVRAQGRLYRIPWREDPAPFRSEARLEILADTLSALTFGEAAAWDERGLLHRGRVHRCGIAALADPRTS
jgi:hypothetical protein